MPLDKKKNKSASIYFIVPAPIGISPGQRFRFEHYLPILRENNIHFRVSSFYSLAAWKNLYKKGNHFKKFFYVLSGLFKRLIDLFRINRFSYIYIYREAAPIGPPFFEWVISNVLRKRIIYDFDDAIWIPATSEFNKAISKFKYADKVANICRWANKVSVGNQFLQNFVHRYNSRVIIIPTVVNVETEHFKQQDQQTVTPSIGWTGSFSTLKYLDIVLPVLQELQEQYDFTFIVIADKDPKLALKHYCFIKWNRETEVEALLNFNIGLMPLYDDEISKGKCGFKAIQYMSLGIPAVVSPVGVNTEIVEDGINGFLCLTQKDWKNKLEELLNNAALRSRMGTAARQKIKEKYSVTVTLQMFMDLFK